MAEVTFEIVEEIGTLSKKKGWSKEINLVSWNRREPVYDLRTWGPDHEIIGKGVTLDEREISRLLELLEQLQI